MDTHLIKAIDRLGFMIFLAALFSRKDITITTIDNTRIEKILKEMGKESDLYKIFFEGDIGK